MVLTGFFFYLFAAITIASAFLVIAARNPGAFGVLSSSWRFLMPPGSSCWWARSSSRCCWWSSMSAPSRCSSCSW
jgi:hypothetical protein